MGVSAFSINASGSGNLQVLFITGCRLLIVKEEIMSEAYCKDCGVSLMPQAENCPVCGAGIEPDSNIEVSMNEEYLSAMDNQVPENYPGY